MDLELALARVDRFDDGRVRASQTETQQVDIGYSNLAWQMSNDLLHGRVQIMAILHQVAGDPRARRRHDESRKRRRGHRQDVVAGAVESRTQYGNCFVVAIAPGAGD